MELQQRLELQLVNSIRHRYQLLILNIAAIDPRDIKSSLKRYTTALPHGYKTLIAGGLAGTISKTALAPLSRITILYQVSSALCSNASAVGVVSSSGSHHSIVSIFGSLLKIVHKEGILALWKGNMASVVHRFPYSAINFTVYEELKDFALKKVGAPETSAVRLLCGAVAGAVACVSCYPLDLVRTRLSVMQSTNGQRARGIVEVLKDIVETEGTKGLYKGCSLSVMLSVPNLAIGFAVYGSWKSYLLSHNIFVDSRSGKINTIGSMLGGAMAGLSSSVLFFPIDVVRRRLQVVGSLKLTSANSIDISPTAGLWTRRALLFATYLPNNHAIQEAKRILILDGLPGFYIGVVPELLRIVPTIAIMFSVYELSLDFMS